MTITIISHADCVLHDPGESHPESPKRTLVIQEALKQYPFAQAPTFLDAPLALREQLLLAHDKQYVDWIFSCAPKEGSVAIDADTIMNPHTLNAAMRAAGAVCFAVDLVMKDKAQVVFCNVRPPGHHAERMVAMGFCFFNNVAVGALHAIEKFHLERITIIDFDVHHGNGTQNIFQNDKRVQYCSSFQHPYYPGYDEELDNHHILNVPLRAGTAGEEYRKLVADAWFDKIAAFKPQLIFFSAGFDAHADDPLADINLHKEDYVWLTTEVMKMAQEYCQGRMISVLEGGYQLEVLAECVPAHVEAMRKR